MKTTLAALIIAILFVCGVSASVPPMINYQGKLMQPSGAPVPDNTYTMQFAIYDVPTGGTALWSETNTAVQVKGGLFAVMLGSVTNLPANIFDDPNRFFGVKVGTDPEMTPRQKIASVAYAQVAGTAAAVSDGAVTTSKLAAGAVTADKLASGTITADKLATGVATPAGTISMFGGPSAPAGWLLCDGTAVSRTAYAGLFAATGTTFGSGDGSTTFNLPDFGGVFPKGAGTTSRTAGKDASGAFYAASLGAYSTDRMQGHHHDLALVAGGVSGLSQCSIMDICQIPTIYTNYGDWKVLNPKTDGVNGTPRTGHTTEPQSLGVTFIIKT